MIDSDNLGYTWEWMGEEPTSWTLQQGVETEVDHGGFGKIKVPYSDLSRFARVTLDLPTSVAG